MGGYFSDSKKDDELGTSVLDFRPRRRRVYRNERELFSDIEPIFVTSEHSSIAADGKYFSTTPKDEEPSRIENYGILPNLIIKKISLYLELNDLFNVFLTCKLFYHCSNSNLFWKHYFLQSNYGERDFFENQRDINWKKIFYSRYHRYTDEYYRKKYIHDDHDETKNQNNEKIEPVTLKLCFLGMSGVGKTSICHRISRDTFREHFTTTIGVAWDYKLFHCKKTGRSFKINLWDTAGQERYRSISTMTDRKSFECEEGEEDRSFRYYLPMIEEAIGSTEDKNRPIMLLLGTKMDLVEKGERVVSSKEAIEFVKKQKHRIHGYVENSSKAGENILVSVGIALDLMMMKYQFLDDTGN